MPRSVPEPQAPCLAATKPLRLFVAIPTSEAVRASAAGVIERLSGEGDVRWVATDLLHLTLKFLGSTPSEKVSALRKELEKTANNFSPFVVELGGAGAFPNLRRPQTVWLGVVGDLERLSALAGAVDRALQPLGFEPESRPFRAHLTIGRVRSPRGLGGLAARLQEAQTPAVSAWRIDRIQLVRSDLRPIGPEYTSLGSFALGGGAGEGTEGGPP
jgi:RNA 2',3'-cyclic 3'-phosphodiesterase